MWLAETGGEARSRTGRGCDEEYWSRMDGV